MEKSAEQQTCPLQLEYCALKLFLEADMYKTFNLQAQSTIFKLSSILFIFLIQYTKKYSQK